jgi:hypothetical protein
MYTTAQRAGHVNLGTVDGEMSMLWCLWVVDDRNSTQCWSMYEEKEQDGGNSKGDMM